MIKVHKGAKWSLKKQHVHLKKCNQNKNMNMDEKNTSKDEVRSSQY